MEALRRAHEKQCARNGTATKLEEITAKFSSTAVTIRLPFHPILLPQLEC